MRVIKQGRVVTDPWERLTELALGDEVPAGDIILPFPFWLAERERLRDHEGQLAVCLDGDDETEDVAPYLDGFAMIAVDFPRFTDGRSYSHARLLRERFGFQGEIRAVGDVLQDQLFFMRRCGIDSFQVRGDKDIDEALAGLQPFTVRYQPAADDAEPICRRR